MMRSTLFRITKNSNHGSFVKRWMVATTSQQKRALKPEQLDGATKEPSLATGTGQGSTGGGTPTSGSPPGYDNALPYALGGAVVAGGIYYYFYNINTSKPKDSEQASSPLEMEQTTQTENASEHHVKMEAKLDKPEGNRVISIAVPPKMKNASVPKKVEEPSHPSQGNRVTMDVVKPPPIDDPSMTQTAIHELDKVKTEQATEALLTSHQSLWTTMDVAFFADLDSLNSSQLKARIVQLATEMRDRTKWEAVRLKEFLALKERETADRYMEILQKQRLEYEDLLATSLREKELVMVDKIHKAIEQKDAEIHHILQTALDAQTHEHNEDKRAFEENTIAQLEARFEEEYSKRMEEMKAKMAQELQAKVSKLSALTEMVKELESALEATQSSKEGSLKAHRLSAAALALAEKLETNQSAAAEINALQAAAGPSGVIAMALSTIPHGAERGVPTLAQLQSQFDYVLTKCRQAALVPKGQPGLEGQLAGILFAALKYPPNPDDPAPENDKDNAEYILARARKHVQLGELGRAIEQLEKLNGQAAFTAADWKKAALHRIAVEKAMKVIKMECALVNESLVE